MLERQCCLIVGLCGCGRTVCDIGWDVLLEVLVKGDVLLRTHTAEVNQVGIFEDDACFYLK